MYAACRTNYKVQRQLPPCTPPNRPISPKSRIAVRVAYRGGGQWHPIYIEQRANRQQQGEDSDCCRQIFEPSCAEAHDVQREGQYDQRRTHRMTAHIFAAHATGRAPARAEQELSPWRKTRGTLAVRTFVH